MNLNLNLNKVHISLKQTEYKIFEMKITIEKLSFTLI